MRILRLVLALISLTPTVSYAAGICNGGILKTTFNPFTNKMDYICTYAIPAGGSPGDCLTTDGASPPTYSWTTCGSAPTVSYFLLEDGTYALLEDGTKILLEN